MTNPHLGQTRRLPLNDLNTHHNNPRRGNIDAIAESLRTHGQFRPLVVNAGTHTGRPNEVLAGNHTLLAARELAGTDHEFTELDCYVIDVDADEATRIVLADNRLADLGSYDDAVLLDLLDSQDDLTGTGYSDDDVEMLRDIMDDAPSLDDLADEYGEPQDTDFNVTLRFSVMPHVAEQWGDWEKAYDTPEEAFEALLDRTGDTTADTPGA